MFGDLVGVGIEHGDHAGLRGDEDILGTLALIENLQQLLDHLHVGLIGLHDQGVEPRVGVILKVPLGAIVVPPPPPPSNEPRMPPAVPPTARRWPDRRPATAAAAAVGAIVPPPKIWSSVSATISAFVLLR